MKRISLLVISIFVLVVFIAGCGGGTGGSFGIIQTEERTNTNSNTQFPDPPIVPPPQGFPNPPGLGDNSQVILPDGSSIIIDIGDGSENDNNNGPPPPPAL
ncbi:MAG: hypothetical protein SNJ70_10335 [Armatimonadota bacterium]